MPYRTRQTTTSPRRVFRLLLASIGVAASALTAGGPAASAQTIQDCVGGSITSLTGAVALSWSPVEGASGYAVGITGPVWAWRSGTTVERGPATGTVVGGLTPGAVYTFTVTGRDGGASLDGSSCRLRYGTPLAGGSLDWADAASVVPSVVDEGDGVRVSWPENLFPAEVDSAQREVRVYVEGMANDVGRRNQLLVVSGGATSAYIDRLTPGEYYRFYVQPRVVGGTFGPVSSSSSFHQPASSATPSRPSVDAAVVDGDRLRVDWSYTGAALSSQRVVVAVLAPGQEPFLNEFFAGAARRSMTVRADQLTNVPAGWDGSLVNASAVTVRGVNTAGRGPLAAPMNTTPAAPGAIESLQAIGSEGNYIDLSWTVGPGARSGVSYEISLSGPRWARGAGLVRTTVAHGTRIGGLTPGVQYEVTVRAINEHGGGAPAIAYVNVGSTNSCDRLPDAPEVVRIGDGSTVRVFWSAMMSCGDVDVVGYRLLVSRSGSTPYADDPLAVFGRTYGPDVRAATLGGFAADTYTFSIVPMTTAGVGTASIETWVGFADAFDSPLPATPTGVGGARGTPTSASVSWDYEGPSVTSFRIEVLAADGGPAGPRVGETIFVPSHLRSWTVDDLDAAFGYEFRVRGVNRIGVGPWSGTSGPVPAP